MHHENARSVVPQHPLALPLLSCCVMARAPRKKPPAKRVRLRPQDPFDLIRLLARSQSDPRKAIGELVQNSLDAGASTVEIEWFNKDGDGKLPTAYSELVLFWIRSNRFRNRARLRVGDVDLL